MFEASSLDASHTSPATSKQTCGSVNGAFLKVTKCEK